MKERKDSNFISNSLIIFPTLSKVFERGLERKGGCRGV
jgi:hypothetical protein